MSTPGTNPMSYNQYVQTIAGLAVYQCSNAATGGNPSTGVYYFVDAPPQLQIPAMLNYSELRIQRDLDFLQSQGSNQYTLTQGQNILSIPVNDFFTILAMRWLQLSNGVIVDGAPLTPVSREVIQNIYGGIGSAGTPEYFALVGDTFGDGANTSLNVMLGPTPNYAYTLEVSGTIRLPSLYQFATVGVADTGYTWISTYLPDMLLMASMIYISMFQRNFGPTADTPESGMTYEKQYQALRLGAIAEENRRKQMGSAWTGYSTPTAATPTR